MVIILAEDKHEVSTIFDFTLVNNVTQWYIILLCCAFNVKKGFWILSVN